MNFDDFFQLNMRLTSATYDGMPNQFYFDFNPSDPYFWIYDKIVYQKDCTFIKSTYKDNTFLPEYAIKEIEKLQETSPDLWTVYGLGEVALITNLIYNHYKIIDKIPEGENKFYGLDFGFNHPTVLTEITEIDSCYYVNELIYQSNLTNNDLIMILNNVIENKNLPIYADCAEPNRIEEIRRNFFNVNPADKRVKDGIDFIKAHKLFITSNSTNIIKEIRSYKWIEKANGIITDDPVKFNDDGMDSMRYGIYTHSKLFKSNNDIFWI
jgi:PBSX family phage terminase large subunit